MDPWEASMHASKTSCFFSCNFTIFSSIVSWVMKRTAFTSRVCPMRCARWMACNSHAGFHQGSSMKTWLAICRFRPSPPAFREMRMIFRVGSVLKATRASSRACMVMPPRKTTQEMPALFSRNSTSSSMAPNCEKTRPLAPGSLAIIFRTSSTRASILVLLRKSWGFTFCMMFLFPSFIVVPSILPLPPLRGPSQIASAALPRSERVSFEPFAGVVLAGCRLRLPLGVAPPSPPSSSLSFCSWPKSTCSFAKQTGQPTPPEGSFGASSR
mmetsp:Transcript_80657/g.214126  ORF Transcript_80657/g.214126 Transcript_80657/m.214126 type:complete len:269 (-) Transcript_80657:372-1178(-)